MLQLKNIYDMSAFAGPMEEQEDDADDEES
jgi:hypothetical protein